MKPISGSKTISRTESSERRSLWIRTASTVFAAGMVTAAALFFRSYALFPGGQPGGSYTGAAEAMVKSVIKKQIEGNLYRQMPDMPPAVAEKMASEQLAAAIKADKTAYESAVRDVVRTMPKQIAPGVSRHYLLEADSYYFLAQTQNLLRHGKVSERIENRKFYDPLRLGPKGFWTPLNYHPYIGVLVYRAASFFDHSLTLMEGLSYTPLVLMVFVIAAFFWLCRIMRLSPAASAAAGFTLVLSPVFLQRSSFGWYDNDAYNIFFPVLHIAFMFKALEASPAKALRWGAGCGFLTGLYAMFWVGWPFIAALTAGTSAALWILGKVRKNAQIPGIGRFFAGYAGSALLFVIFFTSPAGLWEFLSRGAEFVFRFSSSAYEPWPNVFLTVGEANSVSFKRFVHLLANKITIVPILAGLFLGWASFYLHQSRASFLQWLCLALMTLPLTFLALRTERFTLLLVPQAALMCGFGIQLIQSALSAGLNRLKVNPALPKIAAASAGIFFTAALLPMQFIFAHAVSLNGGPIMNDAWYEALVYLREKTPPGSYAQSWWPPGYFITSVAERRVSSDGGTQHMPETYWMARFFISEDEKEAVAILRMLHQSGNDAVEFLQSKGLDLASAIELLNQLFPLSRDEALALLKQRLNAEEAGQAADMLYFTGEPAPAYIFVYDEMVEKNLAISLHGRWNFRKAKTMALESKSKKAAKDEYIQNVIKISGGILKYLPGSPLREVKENISFFQNGLAVNFETKESVILDERNQVRGQPFSLFFVENGELKEVPGQSALVDVSALLYEKNGIAHAVLADRRLIRSMLFQMYYLEGKSLKAFSEVFEVSNKEADTEIQIFKVNWEAADNPERPNEA